MNEVYKLAVTHKDYAFRVLVSENKGEEI
jgi:hypothetical protein